MEDEGEKKIAPIEKKLESMLNSSIALKEEEEEKKPKEEWTLSHADELHKQLMREIGRNVAEIQNEGLGEHALRDLNREINRLLSEKFHWELRIVELGGFRRFAKMIDLDGNIVDLPNPDVRDGSYCYFGAAAKKLPEALRLRKRLNDVYKSFRDKEKAQSMLNRSIALMKKEEEEKKPKEEWILSHADELHKQLMREIGRNVAEIQNEGLGEHALRDLNREINNLLSEKFHWERRIVGLGGTRHFAKMIDLDGNIVDLPNPGVRDHGYFYFGAAAKKLPEALRLRKRQTRNDVYKIDASYRDEEDGVLEREEGPAEKKMRREEMRLAAEEMRLAAEETRLAAEEMRRAAEEMRRAAEEMRREEEEMRREEEEEENKMPRLQKINKVVSEMKKMELVSEGPLEEHSEAKDMLNIQG